MQDQWLAQQHAHHAARKGDVAAQPEHHIRAHAAQHLNALPEGLQQSHGQEGQRERALAAYTGKIYRLKSNAARRHQLAFHAGLTGSAFAAQPMHVPAALAQGLGHGQARENMTACTAGHDQCCASRLHQRPPRCIRMRFSWSMRSTTARATMFIKMAEPP